MGLLFLFFAPFVFANERPKATVACEILLQEGTDFGVTAFPREIALDWRRSQLRIFLNVSEELWSSGFAPGRLSPVLEKVAAGEPLSDAEALELKQMRSRLKQLRFATRMFDVKHRYPLMLHIVTRQLGQVKDALINNRPERAAQIAAKLLPRLRSQRWRALVAEVDAVKLCGRKSLVQHLRAELALIKSALAADTLTPRQFHDVRKVVSGLLALFEITALSGARFAYPSMVEYLSTLNSRMGGLHNELIAQTFRGEIDYEHSPTILPSDIALSLRDLAEGFDSLLKN